MDLEEESSKSELKELDDGEKTENLEKTTHSDEIEVGTNGDVGNDPPIETDHSDVHLVEIEDAEPIEAAKENGDGIGVDRTGKPPSGSIGSPDPEADSSKPALPKGHGLKKWRRIRRDSSKDSTAGADYSVILKRRLPLFETPKVREVSKQKSEGEDEEPISPIELRNPPSVPLEIASGVLDPEIGLLVASSGFSVGVDSDNSEERSSKSSTATSAPRMRHELFGLGRERNRPRGFGGRGSGHAAQQRAQRGRGGGVDASKKFRGNRLRLEKENSHSSSESDLRSTNAVSARWGGTASSNGKQVNVDGEHSDEDQTYEGTGSGIYKENGRVGDSTTEGLGADTLDEGNLGKGEYESHEDLDSFSQSIVLLQAAQEALEKEIEQIREIGKEPMIGEHCNGPLEAFEETSSPVLGVHFLELTQKIEHLEHKLKEASATIDAKESIISNLEAIINRTRHSNESELEFDGLFKKKMEAEVEFLITSRATQNQKSEEQTALYEEQKSLVENQAKMAIKLRNTEDNAIVLMMQAQELEARCEEMLEAEEALKLQNKACKLSLCCFAQSAMLFVALWCFLVQLFPLSEGMAPT